MKPKSHVKGVVPKGRLYRFAKQTLKEQQGNVSKACIEMLSVELERFARTAVQSAWVCALNEKRKTVLEKDTVKGIETARNLFTHDVLDSLIWKLNETKKEVEQNDERRRSLFERDGRGRKVQVG